MPKRFPCKRGDTDSVSCHPLSEVYLTQPGFIPSSNVITALHRPRKLLEMANSDVLEINYIWLVNNISKDWRAAFQSHQNFENYCKDCVGCYRTRATNFRKRFAFINYCCRTKFTKSDYEISPNWSTVDGSLGSVGTRHDATGWLNHLQVNIPIIGMCKYLTAAWFVSLLCGLLNLKFPHHQIHGPRLTNLLRYFTSKRMFLNSVLAHCRDMEGCTKKLQHCICTVIILR